MPDPSNGNPTSRYRKRPMIAEIMQATGTNKGHKCPKCGCCGPHSHAVLETRSNSDGKRRRLECRACGWRFTTMEWVVSSAPEPTDLEAEEPESGD